MGLVSVMWFRRDLRLQDNVALYYALKESEKIVFLFHVNPEQFLEEKSMNQAAFFKSVEKFRNELHKEEITLQILYGEIEDCFGKLKQTVNEWTDVYFNRDEKGFGLKRDQEMSKFFKKHEVNIHSYIDHHIHGAHEISTQKGTPYKIFTPYYNKWKELEKPRKIDVTINKNQLVKERLFEKDFEQFEQLLEKQENINSLNLGEQAAKESLENFVQDHLNRYKEDRDYPMKDATSHLSKYLRSGEISIRTVFDKVQKASDSKAKESFIQELAWRDFYNMIYASHPDQKEQSIDEKFRQIEWDNNRENFKKWKKGQTGFPIVDAAMRQLQDKGWMHNRLRMIVASFLTKDLLIDWRWGEKYFQKMLIDYDAASNIGGWQWAASTGTDGVPYFRIFNPITQSQKFDPDGEFICQYVPELAAIDSKKIHEPATLTEKEQDNWSVKIGEDYPEPIVSHKRNRELAIEAYEKSKERTSEK